MKAIESCGVQTGTDIEDVASLREIHQAAVDEGKHTCIHPISGLTVFTRVGLLSRGRCCASGCLFCPYNHDNIKIERRPALIKQTAWLFRSIEDESDKNLRQNVIILFWSGGKDSFLALRALVRERIHERIILLTTFSAEQRIVGMQNLPISDIVKQAKYLNLDLIGVPLLSNDNGTTAETYQDRIQSGIQLVHNTYESEKLVSAIAFGDLHLNEIVNWRKQFLNQLAPELLFPLFREDAGSNYPALVDELKMSQVECIISASEFPDLIGIGDRFDEELMQKASRNGIDTFGENGEFHTLAKVWTSTSRSTALGLGK